MTKTRWMATVLGLSVMGWMFSATAQAQATRTWVSGVGDDANPCSRTAPCKTFAGAISKTAAGGEISVLDPGGFGAVTITKSITINGDGTLAAILAAGTNGVIVNAGVNDKVILRNLSINGAGTGINGVRFLAGRTLRVESCTVYGFTGNGIDVVHSSTTTPGELTVVKSSFTNINGAAVRVDNAVGAVSPSAALDNVSITRTTIGFNVLKSGVGTISNSAISQVTNQAIIVQNSAVINASSCVLTKNGTGVSVPNAASTVRLSSCQIFNNTTGVNVAVGGTCDTFGTNAILGNGTDVVGVLTFSSLQ